MNSTSVRRIGLVAIALFAVIHLAVSAEISKGTDSAAGVVVAVGSFGAVGDGATLNTEAIQRAIDACSKQGGGTVKFPPR